MSIRQKELYNECAPLFERAGKYKGVCYGDFVRDVILGASHGIDISSIPSVVNIMFPSKGSRDSYVGEVTKPESFGIVVRPMREEDNVTVLSLDSSGGNRILTINACHCELIISFFTSDRLLFRTDTMTLFCGKDYGNGVIPFVRSSMAGSIDINLGDNQYESMNSIVEDVRNRVMRLTDVGCSSDLRKTGKGRIRDLVKAGWKILTSKGEVYKPYKYGTSTPPVTRSTSIMELPGTYTIVIKSKNGQVITLSSLEDATVTVTPSA